MVYGYGWGLADYRGLKLIAHSGGLDGFLSYLLRQPDENLTIAVLTNSTPPLENLYPTRVGNEFLEYILWQKMASQVSYSTDTSLSANQLKAFTGSYDYGRGVQFYSHP